MINESFTCAFHAVTHTGKCPKCFESARDVLDMGKILKSPEWDRARGRTIMLSELHALKIVEDCGADLSRMTPFDIATLGVLQGMLIGMEMAEKTIPNSITKENIGAATASIKSKLI